MLYKKSFLHSLYKKTPKQQFRSIYPDIFTFPPYCWIAIEHGWFKAYAREIISLLVPRCCEIGAILVQIIVNCMSMWNRNQQWFIRATRQPALSVWVSFVWPVLEPFYHPVSPEIVMDLCLVVWTCNPGLCIYAVSQCLLGFAIRHAPLLVWPNLRKVGDNQMVWLLLHMSLFPVEFGLNIWIQMLAEVFGRNS